MTIIKKRADQLRPGDILPATTFHPIRVVQWAQVYVDSSVCMGTVDLTKPMVTAPQALLLGSTEFDVEVPDVPRETTLTPAQEFADELLALVRRVAGSEGGARRSCDDARALLDKIEPPAPPTLAETAAAAGVMVDYLHLIANDPSAWRELADAARKRIDEARAIITRAREASK